MMTKKRQIWIIGLLFLVANTVLGTFWPVNHPVMAQTNLLTNGSLERPYAGQGSSTRTAPDGWGLWIGSGAPSAFPHSDKIQVRDGDVSWNLNQGFAPFTAAGYQRVGGLQSGTVVRATAYGWVYTCNNTGTSCIIADPPYRKSDTSAGASLKVGIDPKGGTDPNAASVQWSAAAAPYDQWAEMSVSATVEGDAATVFLWMSQTNGLAINHVYWDQASLVTTNETPAQAATPTPAYVPFVVPQGVKPDGSIIHTVQAGDTLASITFAYQEYGVTLESIAELNDRIKPNTRFLTIGQEIMILPPGSVDPVTGALKPPGSTPSPEPTEEPAITEEPEESAPAPEPAETAPETPATEVADLPEQTTESDTPPPTYAVLRTSYFPFENGIMLWLEDTRQIYVLVEEAETPGGTFSTYMDTWREGMPETDPAIEPPVGFTQPDKNFGHAWRTYPGVRDMLGWGTGSTINYTALIVRDNGKVLISGPDNRVYELQDGTWLMTDFYAPASEN